MGQKVSQESLAKEKKLLHHTFVHNASLILVLGKERIFESAKRTLPKRRKQKACRKFQMSS